MLRTVRTTAIPSHDSYVPTIGCTDFELFLVHLETKNRSKQNEIEIKIRVEFG